MAASSFRQFGGDSFEALALAPEVTPQFVVDGVLLGQSSVRDARLLELVLGLVTPCGLEQRLQRQFEVDHLFGGQILIQHRRGAGVQFANALGGVQELIALDLAHHHLREFVLDERRHRGDQAAFVVR